MQVKARSGVGRWGAVVTRRKDCEAVSCGQANGSRDRGRDPFQRDAICWQPCILATDRWSRVELVIARRVRTMVRAFGIGFVGVVRRLCDRDRLRNVIGVLVKGGRKRFATWEQCAIKPECDPSHHQRHARRPTPTQRQSDFRYSAVTSRR